MVKIRYAELPAGLHVVTEAGDRCTMVYLKPGLTRAQRKDALMVARRSARFGDGPSLPMLDMAFALAADRTRTTARMTGWAMRKHPLLMLPLLALIAGIIVSGIMASAVLVSVTPRVSLAHSSAHFDHSPSFGQPVGPQASPSPGPAGGAPAPGSPVAAIGQARQPAPPDFSNRSGSRRPREHPVPHAPQVAQVEPEEGMPASGAAG